MDSKVKMTSKIPILITIFILISSTVVAANLLENSTVKLEQYEIQNLKKIELGDRAIFAGNPLTYNLTIRAKEDGIDIFRVVIWDSSKNVLENKTFRVEFEAGELFNITSKRDNESWFLIFTNSPGVYELELSSISKRYILQEDSGGWISSQVIPIYFEVRTFESVNQELAAERTMNLSVEQEVLEKRNIEFAEKAFWVAIASTFMALFSTILTSLSLMFQHKNKWFTLVIAVSCLFVVCIVWVIFNFVLS